MSRARTGENVAELDALVASIEQPTRLGAIAAQAGRPAASVRRQLVSLVHAGRLTYPGYGLFAPAGFRSEAVRRTAPRRRAGTLSRSGVGRRGSGTRGISASA